MSRRKKKKRKLKEDPPEVTSFNYPISQILDARARLAEQLSEFDGKLLTGAVFTRLVDIVHEFFPDKIKYEHICESLRHLASQVPTSQQLTDTAHRLVANAWILRKETPVLPWTIQKFKEWVPVQIRAVRRERDKYGRLGGRFTFLILGGTACAWSMNKWWSLSLCRYLSMGLGFSRRASKKVTAPLPRYPFAVVEQLVNFRLYVQIEPRLCGFEAPMFGRNTHVPDSVRDWNGEMVKYRFRIDTGYTCPQGFPSTYPCHKCRFGYAETCVVGTHALDYVIRPCACCDDQEAPFDPELGLHRCVNCFLSEVQRGKKKV